MLLVIDIGNTNIVSALYDNNQLSAVRRIETKGDIGAYFQKYTQHGVKAIIISSVVPNVNDSVQSICLDLFDVEPCFVTHDSVPFSLELDKPHEVGADRIVNAMAVIEQYQTPAIIVDFGTATTFDVIDQNGAYIGGAIAPGPNLSLEALHMAAAQLPDITIEKPPSIIGKNTLHAMQSGLYWGYVSLIEGIIKRLSLQLGGKPLIIGTGGLAPLFDNGTDIFDKIDQNLTLKGLVAMHKHVNNKKDAA